MFRHTVYVELKEIDRCPCRTEYVHLSAYEAAARKGHLIFGGDE